jgi:secreted trypsin-like serine protease
VFRRDGRRLTTRYIADVLKVMGATTVMTAGVVLLGFSSLVHAETADTLRTQVIGGVPDASGYPATGALSRIEGEAHFACTATLIAPRLVMTAAHCLDDGALSFTLASDARAANGGIMLVRHRAHPDFLASIGAHDVAVAELAEAVNGVTPEALFEERSLTAGLSVAHVGYGPMTDEFDTRRVKNAGSAAVETVSDTEFVVGEAGAVESCGGDSGGPAFVETEAGRRLVGITSRALKISAPCSGGTVLTRLEGERAFVEEAVAALGDASTGSACSVQRLSGNRNDALARVLIATGCCVLRRSGERRRHRG